MQAMDAQGRSSDHYSDAVEITRHINEGRPHALRPGWNGRRCIRRVMPGVWYVSIIQSDGLLQSNDHLLGAVSSNAMTEPPDLPGQKRPRRLVEYLEQLKRVAKLEIDVALPGHGPLISDHRTLIEGRLVFHEKRINKILQYLGDGEKTLYQATTFLFPRLEGIQMFLWSFGGVGSHRLAGSARAGARVGRDELTLWRAI